ncbi:MAG: DNA-directed RNA polymerase subunit beta, partial [Chloroflexota bacterium]
MADATATIDSRAVPFSTRVSEAKSPDILAMQNLIKIQLDSFEWFKREGLKQLFTEISPISDFTGRNLELHFAVPDEPFGKPKYSERESREKDITYSAPLRIRASLKNKQTGEIKDQDIFMGDFPLMTDQGTFVVNGVERVVVSQLVRSPGIYFTAEYDVGTDRNLYMGKLIPNRGAWLEFETSNKSILTVKIDRKRKIPVTTLLRALGYGSNEEITALFADVIDPERDFIKETIDRDITHNVEEGLIEMYKKLRPGDPPTLDNARSLINSLFFNPRRYDLGRVGRYKLNRKLELDVPQETTILEKADLVKIISQLIGLNNSQTRPDDIDHLGNRRVRAVGELIQNQFRVGLLRMERVVKERMTIQDPDAVTPSVLINIRPVVAAMKEFFGGSQLSQFMDQTNPLAELAHKRRLSAMGPGGLSRERAGFDVRDVHHSHYGRVCPIETPEGPNIGLIGSLATYARINEFGFIETPYRKVVHPALDGDGGSAVAKRSYVSDEIEYLAADEEEKYIIAQANARLNEKGEFVDDRVSTRQGGHFAEQAIARVQYMDISPKQIVSVPTALIPFLEHDDANRALMGSNMQRQAVPLLAPEAPLVGTGVERQAALDSGQVVVCQEPGEVTSVTAREIVVQSDGHQRAYPLRKFERSNNGTCINQRPIVRRGDLVQVNQALADSSSTDHGELALGQNILCAFMFWDGGNFEDAILISERVVRD